MSQKGREGSGPGACVEKMFSRGVKEAAFSRHRRVSALLSSENQRSRDSQNLRFPLVQELRTLVLKKIRPESRLFY